MRNLVQRPLGRFHSDEQGTSLTEFAIILPIFLMILMFIYHMGVIGNTITLEWTQAQRDLWERVGATQELSHVPINAADSSQPHTSPSAAANHARAHLDAFPVREQREGYLSAAVAGNERSTYQAMGSRGHWGESHARTRPAASRMNLFRSSRSATDNASDVVGASRYAQFVVDDGTGSPVDYIVNSALPQVLGAGVRYGTIYAVREQSIQFNHDRFNIEMDIEFNVLAPPRPPPNAEFWGTEITRAQLSRYQPYENLLGIAEHQPLGRDSAPGVPTAWSTPLD